MSRVTPWSVAPGMARSRAALNTTLASIGTVSAAVDGVNWNQQGLDLRNFAAKAFTELEVSGSRQGYVEKTTLRVYAADGLMNNEAATPLVMGTALELDWTGVEYSLAAATDVILVEADLAIGDPAAAGGVPQGAADAGAPGASGGISAVIIVDYGAGYVVEARSRQTVSGKNGGAGSRQTFQFDQVLSPQFCINTSDSIRKIGVAVGVNTGTARIYRGQLTATILKRSR